MPRSGRLILVVSVLLAIAVFLVPQPAAACDFPPHPPPQEALEEATAVFSGEVTSIEPAEDDPSQQYLVVTFSVDRVWKGIDSSPVIVETHQDEGVCGFPFEVSESYLVYAHSNGSPLTTALYHRTQLLERADEDLEVIGQGTEVDASGETDDGGQTISAGVLLLIVVIASILVATVMLLRQSKPGLPESYEDDDAGEDDPAGKR